MQLIKLFYTLDLKALFSIGGGLIWPYVFRRIPGHLLSIVIFFEKRINFVSGMAYGLELIPVAGMRGIQMGHNTILHHPKIFPDWILVRFVADLR